jgi:hypothetical protein
MSVSGQKSFSAATANVIKTIRALAAKYSAMGIASSLTTRRSLWSLLMSDTTQGLGIPLCRSHEAHDSNLTLQLSHWPVGFTNSKAVGP